MNQIFVLKIKGSPLYFAGHDLNGSFKITPYIYNAQGMQDNRYAEECATIINRMFPGLEFIAILKD